MLPTTISYSYAEVKNYVRHGRAYAEFTDLGNLSIEMPFSEYVKRSTSEPDHSDMISHLINHNDEESFVEAILKSGMGRKIALTLNRQLQEVTA